MAGAYTDVQPKFEKKSKYDGTDEKFREWVLRQKSDESQNK